jgi:hypothetical protein
MALAAPELTRDVYLDRLAKTIPEGAPEAPLNAWQAEIARRAQADMEAGDLTKVNALRQQCSSIIGFTQYRFPRYQPARHHRLIAGT